MSYMAKPVLQIRVSEEEMQWLDERAKELKVNRTAAARILLFSDQTNSRTTTAPTPDTGPATAPSPDASPPASSKMPPPPRYSVAPENCRHPNYLRTASGLCRSCGDQK